MSEGKTKGIDVKDLLTFGALLGMAATMIGWGFSEGAFRQKAETESIAQKEVVSKVDEHTIIITRLVTLFEGMEEANRLMREELKNKKDK